MKKSYLMLYCTIIDDNEITKQLFTVFCNTVQKHFPMAAVTVETNTIYWKVPHCRKIIYNLRNTAPIAVRDFIKIFDLNWNYSDGMVQDAATGEQYYQEDAFWSKLSNSEETFLIPEVRWVHVYTWLDDEKANEE
jgi:hypothetical protein